MVFASFIKTYPYLAPLLFRMSWCDRGFGKSKNEIHKRLVVSTISRLKLYIATMELLLMILSPCRLPISINTSPLIAAKKHDNIIRYISDSWVRFDVLNWKDYITMATKNLYIQEVNRRLLRIRCQSSCTWKYSRKR